MFALEKDLFACGVQEPCSSATVCNVFGVDDLIIVGIIAAASIAASQISASESEGNAKDILGTQKNNQMRNQQINYYRDKAAKAAAGVASRHGGHGGTSSAEELQPWVDKQNIDTGYDAQMKAASKQADQIRLGGYMQAGTTLAGGLARAGMGSAAAGGIEPGAGYGDTGMGLAERAGQYDLNPQSSQLLGATGQNMVSTPQIHTTDPFGGFQLQEDDYRLLGGQDPNRYRFGI